MTRATIEAISPFFIVSDVPSSLAFHRDRLGFEITFQVPNHTRDVQQGMARWDAFLFAPDPDALAAEYASRGLELWEPLADTDDGLRGFALEDADGYILFFGRPR